MRYATDYSGSPVATLNDILVVVELEHELVHAFCLMIVLEARYIRVGGESKAEEGWSDDMKAGFIQQREDLLHLVDRAGPTVLEEKGYGIWI